MKTARNIAQMWLLTAAATLQLLALEVKPKAPPRQKKLRPPAWLQEAQEVRE